MSELITFRSAAADVRGDAYVDRDEGGHDVDCEEVIEGAQSRVEPVLGIWFLLWFLENIISDFVGWKLRILTTLDFY